MKKINKIYLTRRDSRNLEYTTETEFGLDFFFKKNHIIICDILKDNILKKDHTIDKDNNNIKILSVLKNYSISKIEYFEYQNTNKNPIEEIKL